jgi:hypothetical protein
MTSGVTGSKFGVHNDQIVVFTSSNKQIADCKYENMDSSKIYMLSFKFDEVSGNFNNFAPYETGKAANVDLDSSSSSVVYTQVQNSFASSACVDQSLHLISSNRSLKFGNDTCEVLKTIFIKSNQDYSTIAVLGTDIYHSRRVDVYTVTHASSVVSLVQSIATFHALDVISINVDLGTFLIIANTYDSSPGSLTISYTVPVFIYR